MTQDSCGINKVQLAGKEHKLTIVLKGCMMYCMTGFRSQDLSETVFIGLNAVM